VVEEANKTKQNAEYAPIINTNINITKNEEIAEKDQVEEAAKTKQNARYTLPFTTHIPIIETKTPNEFTKVSIDRDSTEEFNVEQ
jgi:hypothetical protein